MVSVNNVVGFGFDVVLTTLDEFIRAHTGELTPEDGFCRFVYASAGESGPLTAGDVSWSGDVLRQGLAPVLAAAGYALARSEFPESCLDSFTSGLQRLSLKDAFAVDHQTFAFRPVEFLGIALGASACDRVPTGTRTWLGDALNRLRVQASRDYWSQSLYRIAAIGLQGSWPVAHLHDLEHAQIEELALRRWLAAASQRLSWPPEERQILAETDVHLLKQAVEKGPTVRDAARAAVVHLAIRRAVFDHIESQVARTWQIAQQSQDAVKLVQELCRRFPGIAKALVKRQRGRRAFTIKDEYDVQDLLHGVLKLHFDDVRPEEWTPSYAGNSSRMDFLLKRERLIVEAKMTRKGLDQKEVTNQLIQDRERYRSHPDCGALVCLVYDPSGICANPAALENDLAQSNVEGPPVVAVVSPRGL